MGWFTSASSEVPSEGWELQDIIDKEAAALLVSQTDKILASPPQFKDFATGQMISNARVVEICKACDSIRSRLKAARTTYKRVMKETPGSYEVKKMAAKKASEEHAGGSYTQIWNRQCAEKICISICVTAPPAFTQDEAYDNEKKLLMLIQQCDPTLEGWWQDIWTSVKEIGTLGQTYIYVRYPYHLGVKLNVLCQVLNTVRVESHTFSAGVVTEGRKQLQEEPPVPWQPHINGHILQQLNKEEMKAATKMGSTSCEERFIQAAADCTHHLDFHKSTEGEAESAATQIWQHDWAEIQLNNTAYKFSEIMAKRDEVATLRVYFMIYGKVVHAADKEWNEHGKGGVFFYTCTTGTSYPGEVMMSTQPGDRILALDAPFKLTFGEANEGSVLDAPGGIMAVYAFKYDVDGDQGIVIHKAGLVMLQHMTPEHHHNQLQIFGGQMAPRIAQFGAKIAVLSAAQVGGDASSSSTANLLHLEQ